MLILGQEQCFLSTHQFTLSGLIFQLGIRHDCGLVVNPGQVTAQIEGNIAWGCSVALQERAEIRDGANANDSFETYPILRQEDSPEVEVTLVEHDGDPPSGAGEPAIAPTPAALVNAVFAATGTRHRRLPIRD